MAEKNREVFDPISLSFTDVLTCVLGASVALFLIFVAIVKLTSSESVASGKQSGNHTQKARSIQKEMDKGFATASIRIVSNSPQLIERLVIEPSLATVQQRSLVTHKSNQKYQGKLLHFQEGLSHTFSFYLSELQQEPSIDRQNVFHGQLFVQLIVGGLPIFCEVTIPSNQDRTKQHLFSLSKSFDRYFKFYNASSNCRETF